MQNASVQRTITRKYYTKIKKKKYASLHLQYALFVSEILLVYKYLLKY